MSEIKAPKDMMMNSLGLGQTVLLKMNSPYVIGKIAKISHGGLQLPTEKGITAGHIQILIDMSVSFKPETVIPDIIRVVNPKDTEEVMKLAGIIDKRPLN